MNPRLQVRPSHLSIQSDSDIERDDQRDGANSAFRDDFLRKYDMGCFAGASLFRNAERQVLVSVERRFSPGAFQPDELLLLKAAWL